MFLVSGQIYWSRSIDLAHLRKKMSTLRTAVKVPIRRLDAVLRMMIIITNFLKILILLSQILINLHVHVVVRSKVKGPNLQICEYFFSLEPKDIFFSQKSPDFGTIASGKLSAISRGAGDLPTPSELRVRSI